MLPAANADAPASNAVLKSAIFVITANNQRNGYCLCNGFNQYSIIAFQGAVAINEVEHFAYAHFPLPIPLFPIHIPLPQLKQPVIIFANRMFIFTNHMFTLEMTSCHLAKPMFTLEMMIFSLEMTAFNLEMTAFSLALLR